MKNMTKSTTSIKATCRYCEYVDQSTLAEQVAERHAALSGHEIVIVKTEEYVIRGEK